MEMLRKLDWVRLRFLQSTKLIAIVGFATLAMVAVCERSAQSVEKQEIPYDPEDPFKVKALSHNPKLERVFHYFHSDFCAELKEKTYCYLPYQTLYRLAQAAPQDYALIEPYLLNRKDKYLKIKNFKKELPKGANFLVEAAMRDRPDIVLADYELHVPDGERKPVDGIDGALIQRYIISRLNFPYQLAKIKEFKDSLPENARLIEEATNSRRTDILKLIRKRNVLGFLVASNGFRGRLAPYFNSKLNTEEFLSEVSKIEAFMNERGFVVDRNLMHADLIYEAQQEGRQDIVEAYFRVRQLARTHLNFIEGDALEPENFEAIQAQGVLFRNQLLKGIFIHPSIRNSKNSSSSGGAPILWTAGLEGCVDACQALIQAGADVRDKNKYGKTALSGVLMNRRLFGDNLGEVEDLIDLLIHSGADLDCALETVISNSPAELELVKRLVSLGADPNRMLDRGYPLIYLAVNRPEVLKLFVEDFQVNPDQRVLKTGDSLLHWAAEGNSIESIQYLLKVGVDPNVIISEEGPYQGWTSLHVLSGDKHSQVETAKTLIEGGANPNLKDALGKTALDYAKESQAPNVELIQYLEEVMEKNRLGESPA